MLLIIVQRTYITENAPAYTETDMHYKTWCSSHVTTKLQKTCCCEVVVSVVCIHAEPRGRVRTPAYRCTHSQWPQMTKWPLLLTNFLSDDFSIEDLSSVQTFNLNQHADAFTRVVMDSFSTASSSELCLNEFPSLLTDSKRLQPLNKTFNMEFLSGKLEQTLCADQTNHQ